MIALAPDPPVRDDGKCAVCPKQRHPERSVKYGGLEAELDPFCSSTCARAYHGCALPKADQGGAAKRYDEVLI